MNSPILAPAAALILWSLLVMLYMVVTRFSAFSRTGVDVSTSAPGGRYVDLEESMPARVNWPSHNYTHLMEQPTLFYAVVMVLALADVGEGANLMLAWAYVASRIIHSVWQIGFNIVRIRIVIFSVSSTILIALAVNALRATF